MLTKLDLAKDWLPRYTGMSIDDFGDYVLLTNFKNYLTQFANQFGCDIQGENRPMQAATNTAGLSMVNFHIGSANAATIMDLLIARQPKGVLFLGKCGGLKQSAEIGHFILPIAAIRGEGTSDDYLPPQSSGTSLVQAAQVCLGTTRQSKPGISHRGRLLDQSTAVGTRRRFQRRSAGNDGNCHRHGNSNSFCRRAQEPNRPRCAATGVGSAHGPRRCQNSAKRRAGNPRSLRFTSTVGHRVPVSNW